MQFPFSLYLRFNYVAAAAAVSLAVSASNVRACSVCGCSLSSDWAIQGYEAMQGTDLNARFEYYNQNQLRSGSGTVDRASLELPNDREIQQETVNRGYWLGIDHVFAPHWGIMAELPYYDRFHTTIAEGDTEISTSHGRGIGDLRLLGRYQQHTRERGWGVQFGLKLPTGKTDQTFSEGPAAGEELDRGLQLGTGSYDLLLGASYFSRIGETFDAFGQVLLDQPFTRKDDFKPSTSLNVNVGVRWLNTSRVTPQVQLNARFDGREHGAKGDFDNSGGTLAYVSPGATVEITRHANGFVFLQLPVYQRVNGYQIEPHWLLSTGIRWRL